MIHTQTHTHACTRTHTHTHTHMHARTHKHTHAHTCMHTHIVSKHHKNIYLYCIGRIYHASFNFANFKTFTKIKTSTAHDIVSFACLLLHVQPLRLFAISKCILTYFKPIGNHNGEQQPNGPLTKELPSSVISVANKGIVESLKKESSRKRKDRMLSSQIAQYATENGCSKIYVPPYKHKYTTLTSLLCYIIRFEA